jgi:tryptophan aminotransferase
MTIFAVRNLTPLESVDGMISLLAGKPNPTMFPISSISFAVQNPGGDQTELSMTGKALEEAMQYNLVQGLPALIEWATELQEIVHHRYRSEGWAVSIGVGSADLISKVRALKFNHLPRVTNFTQVH